MRHHRRGRAAPLIVAGLLLAAACSSDVDGDDGDDAGGATPAPPATEPPALPAGYEDHVSETYDDDAHWLCLPGKPDDVCSIDLDATAVAADGSTEVEPHVVGDDPPVDCFYVYPTVSRDETANSDLEPGEGEEIATVWNQAARLTSQCRVFAPLYRQVTLASLGGGVPAGPEAWETAYADVVDAFTHYVAHESDGRGFVLLGHSQGAGMITQLIQDEIEGEPLLRDRLVAAYVLGSTVQVPEDDVVGGTFADVPLCEDAAQTGCVVTYSSYRSTNPPVDGSFFGEDGDDTRAACVNPAALDGGAAALQPYFKLVPAEGSLLGGTSAIDPYSDPARTAEITTPWVTYPDFVIGECVAEDGYTYLALTVDGDADDPRTDDIPGDLTDQWGMHLIDANVAMGDIIDLVAGQAEAYTG
jgi:hypothetical protein